MFNQAILIGRVGRTPEEKQTRNGTGYMTFSLATSETWKDRNTGEKREETIWHNVTVWPEGLCRVVRDFVVKGDLLTVIGQVRNRSWQDDAGNWHNASELRIAGNGQIRLMPKGGNKTGDPGPDEPLSHATAGASTAHSALDDEVPF